MMTRELLSLRETADELEIETLRLYRLGRYLRIAPGDPCLPSGVISRAKAETAGERRYRIVLDWLLGNLPSSRAHDWYQG
jgi:hypothetical protein